MDKRTKIFPVRWTEAEFEEIGRLAAAADMKPGRFVREATLNGTVSHTPSINRDQWRDFANLANNLNQLVRSINVGRADPGSRALIEEMRPIIQGIRKALVP